MTVNFALLFRTTVTSYREAMVYNRTIVQVERAQETDELDTVQFYRTTAQWRSLDIENTPRTHNFFSQCSTEQF